MLTLGLIHLLWSVGKICLNLNLIYRKPTYLIGKLKRLKMTVDAICNKGGPQEMLIHFTPLCYSYLY